MKRGRNQSTINTKKDKRPIINVQKLLTTGVIGVIFTNSLSTIMAEFGNNHTKNPKTRKIRQLMNKRKGNLTLCWVPGHAGITGNEEESIPNDEKFPPEDSTDGLRRKWRAADKMVGS
jgi:hypothetical protein